LSSSRIKINTINLMFIPPAGKKMCLLTPAHPLQLRAARKIYPLLAPGPELQEPFLDKVLRKETEAWKGAHSS